jgi:hypothetical protein
MIKWGLKKIFYALLSVWFLFVTGSFIFLTFISSGGIGGAIGLGSILFFAMGLPFTLVYLLFYNLLIKPALMIAILGPYIIIRLLTRIFVIIPLTYVGAAAEGGVSFFDKAEDNIQNSPKKYGAFFGLILLLCFWIFLPRDLSSLVSFISSATLISFVIFSIPVIATVIVAGLSFKFGDKDEEDVEDTDDTKKVVEAATAGFEAGKEAHGLYRDLQDPAKQKAVKEGAKKAKNAAVKVGSTADSKVPKGLLNTVGKIPGVKRIVPWIASTAGAEAVLALIVLLLIILVVWVIVIIVFYAAMYAILGPYLGGVMGFADAQLGLGMDYGQWIGQEVGGRAPNYDFTGERNALRVAWGRVQCALQGPQCLRELQANNTQRPGSESVGVEFGLEIEDFSVNSGHVFDISGRYKDDTVPVSFDVYNPVKNFRGIDAYNVQYRMTFDGGETCIANGDSGSWGEPLGDNPGETKGSGGAIPAGSFDRPVGTLNDLTLENCGMLQPALSIYRTVRLQLLYDYSSQSTLQFQAMSEEYMMEEGLRPDPEKSQTANTPVKTYVNVQSPVVFQDRNGVRAPDVVPVYVGFETDKLDINYKIDVDELRIISSDAMIDVDTAEERYGRSFNGDCHDLKHEGNGVYTLNDSSSSIRNLEEVQNDSWWSSGAGPSPFRCDMMIDPGSSSGTGPINSISPTGETLTMRVDANYTLRLSSQSQNFEVKNTRCVAGNLECPLIVTANETDGSTLRNTCNSNWRIDASSGCTVVENQNKWGNPERVNNGTNYKRYIENREYAYYLSNIRDELISAPESSPNSYINEELYNPDAAVGLELNKLQDQNFVAGLNTDSNLVRRSNTEASGFKIVNSGSRSNIHAEIESMDYKLCNSDSGRVEDFLNVETNSPVIMAQIETVQCNGGSIGGASCSQDDVKVRRNGRARCLS